MLSPTLIGQWIRYPHIWHLYISRVNAHFSGRVRDMPTLPRYCEELPLYPHFAGTPFSFFSLTTHHSRLRCDAMLPRHSIHITSCLQFRVRARLSPFPAAWRPKRSRRFGPLRVVGANSLARSQDPAKNNIARPARTQNISSN